MSRVLKDEKHAETIFQEKVEKIVLTFDRFPDSFINDAFDIVVFAYDVMKDNRFRYSHLFMYLFISRIGFEGGVLTMVFGEDFSTDEARRLHLQIKKILGFRVETALKNAKVR